MNIRYQYSTMHLLLVDDHQIVREGLKRLLAPANSEWVVTEVSNGHQAVDFMRQQRVDLAIVDLSMPGMSGLDLIRRIKADHPNTAVLVLSMHAEEQYAMRAFKLGANGYVTKDSAATELVNEQGYRGASVDRISARLNLTKGAFYHHHENKLDLIAACFERSFGVLRHVLQAAEQAQGPGWQRCCATMEMLLR